MPGGDYGAFVYTSLSYPHCYEPARFANTCGFVNYINILFYTHVLKKEILQFSFSVR